MTLLPWLTMAEALGPHRDGWALRHNFSDVGRADKKSRPRPASEPAPTVDTKARSWSWAPALGAADLPPEARRLTVEEAALLQTFPADFPWRGARTQRFRQIGNAVPPGLALVVLAHLTDRRPA